MRRASANAVLEVEDLRTIFHTREGAVYAVNGVSFELRSGELLGVVGESGSGKSVTMMSLMNLLPTPPAEIVSGEVRVEGRDVRAMDDEQMRALRGGDIGFIFQDPMTSLNPVFTVGFQLVEPLREHLGLSKKEARARAVALLERVGIPDAASRLSDYPHQFSGGMRQRVMIAIALSCNPKVLIADEPTTALDVTIQAQILELVRELRQDHGMGIVWITHDLGVVAGIADRVMVMYAGMVVEHAAVGEVFSRPAHPYTRALLETLPSVDEGRPARLQSISGQPPLLTAFPNACPFHARCAHVTAQCRVENPPLRAINENHHVACWWSAKEDGVSGD